MDSSNNREQEHGIEFARLYINRQNYNKAYKSNVALKKGTLFPELYLVESNNYNDWLYENPVNRVK